MTTENTWADLIEAAQQLKAEDLVPALARMKKAHAIDAANARQRADDPGVRDIRVYPLGLGPTQMLRATLAEAMLIEIRYLLVRGQIGVRDLVAAMPDDQLKSLARQAFATLGEREVRRYVEEMPELRLKLEAERR